MGIIWMAIGNIPKSPTNVCKLELSLWIIAVNFTSYFITDRLTIGGNYPKMFWWNFEFMAFFFGMGVMKNAYNCSLLHSLAQHIHHD